MRVLTRGLTVLLLFVPGLGWAKPSVPMPHPTVVQQAETAAAAVDPFSPVKPIQAPTSGMRLPPPPTKGIPLPETMNNPDAPTLVGKIDGKFILQTSAGIEIRNKLEPKPSAPVLFPTRRQ